MENVFPDPRLLKMWRSQLYFIGKCASLKIILFNRVYLMTVISVIIIFLQIKTKLIIIKKIFD